MECIGKLRINMKAFNQSNCTASVRNRATDKYGKVILCGQHAFVWSITIVLLTGSTMGTAIQMVKSARKEFKNILKRN